MTISADEAMQYLVSKGLSRVAAAALIGNAQAESNLDASVEEKTPNRYGTRGLGLFQHTAGRRDALTQYAADAGSRASDPYTQMDFLIHELRGSEKRAGDLLANATTAEEANRAVLATLRPSGWTPMGDVTLSSQYATRLKNTQALLGSSEEPAPQTATPSPYSPAPLQQAVADVPAYVPALQQQDARDPYGEVLGKATHGLMSMFASAAPAPMPQAPMAAPMAPPIPRPALQQRPALPALAQPTAQRPAGPAKITFEDIARQLGGIWGAWS